MDNVTERPRPVSRNITAGVAIGWTLATIAAAVNVLTALAILIGRAVAGPIENPAMSFADYALFTLAKLAISGVALGLGYVSMRLTRAGRLPFAVALWIVLAVMAGAFAFTPAAILWLPTV